MLRGSLALASVQLCLACLLVLASQSKPCSKDVFGFVQKLLQSDPNSNCSGCRLYTPSIEDYKPESGCLQCELQKEEAADKFLANLLETLQMMNSQHC